VSRFKEKNSNGSITKSCFDGHNVIAPYYVCIENRQVIMQSFYNLSTPSINSFHFQTVPSENSLRTCNFWPILSSAASAASTSSMDISGGSSGQGGFLHLLAEVATRELAKDKERKHRGKAAAGRNLADAEDLSLERLARMNGATLLRLFAESESDEVRRHFSFICSLTPNRCQHRESSFGSEDRAKAAMKSHLLAHVRRLTERPEEFGHFRAESIQARRRRLARMRASVEESDDLMGPPSSAPASRKRKSPRGLADGNDRLDVWLPSTADHDYGVYSTIKMKSAYEESPDDKNRPPSPLTRAAQYVEWAKAVRRSRKDDLTETSMALDGATPATLVLCHGVATAPVVPVIGQEVEVGVGDQESSELAFSSPSSSRSSSPEPKRLRLDATAQEIPLESNENLSPEELRERELALNAIKELKAAGSSAMDFWCRLCSPHRRFTAYTTLLSHLRSHAGVRPYECSQCNAVFTRQHSLNYHQLIHDNKTRFTCPDCGKRFRHPSHYKEHLRRHTGESPYRCGECDLRYKTRNTYKRHLRVFHLKELTAGGDLRELNPDEIAKIKKGDVEKEREKVTAKKKESTESRDDQQEEEDDEEVSNISALLEETESILERKVIIREGSSSEGSSYSPSTSSEFSSPEAPEEKPPVDESNEQAQAAPILFNDTPPSNLSVAPRVVRRDASPITDPARMSPRKHDRSPNLLESASGGAFNPIEQKMKASPIMQQLRPVTAPGAGAGKAFFATIDGKQVLLIPTSTASTQSATAKIAPKMEAQRTVVTAPAAASGDPSPLLEQCLRYGSAAVATKGAPNLPAPRLAIPAKGQAKLVSVARSIKPAAAPRGRTTLVVTQPSPLAGIKVASGIKAANGIKAASDVTAANGIRLAPVAVNGRIQVAPASRHFVLAPAPRPSASPAIATVKFS